MMPREWSSIPTSDADSNNTRSKRSKKKKTRTTTPLNDSLRNNDEMYMQINLQDLEAYTQQILQAERARRRATYCRVGCTLLWVGLMLVGGYTAKQGLVMDIINSDDTDSNNNSTAVEPTLFQDMDHDQDDNGNKYKPYPLTSCEVELVHNTSFHDLIQHFKENSDRSKQWHCRKEFPDCDWVNPTAPEARKSNDPTIMDGWKNTFLQNQAVIAAAEGGETDYDVAFVGGSLVEHLEGSVLGKQVTKLKRDEDVFETLFTTQGGGNIEGIAFGIGGDRTSQLLYRLQNGELTYGFQPKVWWIMIGTKDWQLGVAPESIVAGMIRIVQSIRTIHPTALIVINSLLPHNDEHSSGNDKSIQRVNSMLGCYVKAQSLIDEDRKRQQEQRQNRTVHHHKRQLHFFNATNIFMEKLEQDGSYQVNPEFMMPGREDDPDAHGVFRWGKKMVERVQQLIQAP